MPDTPDVGLGIGPLMARRRGDMLRAVAGELAATADEAHRLDAELFAAKDWIKRLKAELAARPSVAAERGPVPPVAGIGEVTPATGAAVLGLRPARWRDEPADEWAARCYLQGYRVGYAAGQRFAEHQAVQSSDGVTHEVSLVVVGDDGPVGQLRASFTPTEPSPDMTELRPL